MSCQRPSRFWGLGCPKIYHEVEDTLARGWKAWHHRMDLVMMAMLFMLEERVEQQEDYPLLTCSDIETLPAHFLPRRDIDVDEVIRQMELRHNST